MSREISSFEDLKTWQSCRELRLLLEQLIKTLPENEKYRLSDQITRAARSVTNNIAEGYGRFHHKENIQFCRHSRGSLYELIDHLLICYDNHFINKEQFETLKGKCMDCIKMINGYTNFLQKQAQLPK